MPSTSVQAELQMPSMMTRSLAVTHLGVLGLVLLDIAAVVARDVQVGESRPAPQQDSDETKDTHLDAHKSNVSCDVRPNNGLTGACRVHPHLALPKRENLGHSDGEADRSPVARERIEKIAPFYWLVLMSAIEIR